MKILHGKVFGKAEILRMKVSPCGEEVVGMARCKA
jgi:hypothetical protein